MNKTLGIDLGSNSLGWAILDDSTLDIVDKGVVVFPEGVSQDAGTSLETPAAERRSKRMGRRMKFRRKLRKWHLLSLLIDEKMCPLTHDELDAWRKRGIYPVGNVDFIRWLKATDVSNPYCDRNAAAEGPVPPFTLGRALYHICQRRGFKSSRKEEAAELDAESGEAKKDADRKQGEVKQGIFALTQGIDETGAKTLGQYFFRILERDKDKPLRQRVRGLYTGRIEHYLHEFNVIMDAQKISGQLRKNLEDAIFMQRPLRSQKHLVGNCPLETRNSRAQIGHPAYEEFRLLDFVNNLSLEDENGNWRDDLGNFLYPLTQADRDRIVAEVGKIKSASCKFSTILKLFKKDERFTVRKLKFHHYEQDDAVPACPTRCRIALAFRGVPYDEQQVFDALTFYDDREKLEGWFRKHYPQLDDKSVKTAAAIYPKEGNASYSLKAINRILPYLRRGYELSYARFCAKLPDVVPNYASREDEVLLHIEETYRKHRQERAERAQFDPRARKNLPTLPTLYERYAEMLLNDFGVTSEMFLKLYLRGDDTYEKETCYYPHGKRSEPVMLDKPRLPPVQLGMIRNPLVQRSMTTLRRLVNYLGEHGKLDTNDTIRIELVRSVNDFATRKAWSEWQDQRRKKREEAAAEIVANGKAATDDAIERYILWDEQGRRCLYTGRSISVKELLEGNSFDIEHTVPRSLSGDDSLANKTICEVDYNRNVKKGRVPRDCPNWNELETRLRPWRDHLEQLEKDYRKQHHSATGKGDPAAKSKASVKAAVTRFERDYWREKLRRFDITMDRLTARDGELGGFKRRQLVDTGIMCSHAVDLLKCLYPRTFSVNGAATAFARKAWGLQGDEAKDRTEHTHHAMDAMVIAALTPARFTAICTALKDDGVWRGRECDACPPPCEGFADKVRLATGEILVKHIMRQTTLRQSSKRNALAHAHTIGGVDGAPMVKSVLSRGDTVRGALHKDTFYGCINDPSTNTLQKVVRKPLVGPVKDAVSILDKIVDPSIRTIVANAVEGMKSRGVKNIAAGDIRMPSGVPINKVRIFTPTAKNAQRLRDHAMPSKHDYKNPYYVTSAEGSNFRLAVFCVNGKYSTCPDNSLVWAQNHKKPDYVPYDKQDGFIGYIVPGAMALTHAEGNPDELRSLSQKELCKRLYKVVKFRGDGLITFRRHIEARASVVLAKDLKDIGKHAAGESRIDNERPHELLLLSPGSYINQMLFEGIHFKMMLDGTIVFNT